MSVNTEQIVTSNKVKHSDEGFKYFIGYQEDETVKPFCIILPKMSGYIKYFENRGKNMSFIAKYDNVLDKYNKIWDKIKEKLNNKFHSMPVYDGKYIKAKVREFDCKIKLNLLGNGVPKENMNYTCIACITVDSVMRMGKNSYPQVCLEECEYKMKKTKIRKFIEAELESDSESEPGAEPKSDAKLMEKLESCSDSR